MYSHFRTYNVATASHYHLYLLSYQCGTCLWYINYDLLFHQNSSKRQNQWQSNNVWPFEFISASLRSLPDFYRFVENWFGFILIHDKYRLNVKICWECKFVGDEYPRNQQKLSTTNINNSQVSCPISRSFSIIFSKLYNTVGYYRTSREERAKVYRVR